MSVSSRRHGSNRTGFALLARSLRVGVSASSLIAAGLTGVAAHAATFDLAGSNLTVSGLIGSDTYVNSGADADLIDDFAGNALFTGTIADGAGTIRLIKNGAGNQNLASANSYSGGTQLFAGTLRFNNALSFGSGDITFTGAGVLSPSGSNVTIANNLVLGVAGTYDSAGVTSGISGVVSGGGTLFVQGNGALQLLNSANTYTGGTELVGGGVRVGGTNSLGTGTVTSGPGTSTFGLANAASSVTVGNAFVLNSQLNIALPDAGEAITLTGPVSGASRFFLNTGAGTLVLPNATANTGNTLINSGFIGAGNNASISSGTGQILFGNGAGVTAGIAAYANNLSLANRIGVGGPVTIDTRGFDLNLTGIIGNRAAFPVSPITKIGNGRLTLTRTNTFTGPVTVADGELHVTGTTTAASTVGVDSGATLSGSGSVGGTVTVANGGIINPGTIGGAGTLTLGNLTLGSSSLLNFDLGAPLGIADLITVNGDIGFGGTINVNALAGFAPGTYRLINYAGISSGAFAGVNVPVGYTFVLDTATANQVNLIVSLLGVGPFSFWDGAATNTTTIEGGPGTWNATNTNWTNAAGDTNDVWDGTVANFGVVGGAVAVVGTQAFDQLNFTADGYALTGDTLAGSAIAGVSVDGGVTATIDDVITGASGLTKGGAGTLVLGGANGFDGLSVTGGTVAVTNAGALGVGNATFNGGTTLRADAALTLANDLVLGGTTTVDTHNFALTLGGTIGGAALAIVDTGVTPLGGLVTLSGTNTYTGGTTVTLARVSVSQDANLGTGSVTLFDGSLESSASFVTAKNFSLQDTYGRFITAPGTTLTLDGVVSGANLQKYGTGTLELTNAANSYNGTSISSGTLRIANDGALGVGVLAFNATGGATTILQLGAALSDSRAVFFNTAGTIDTQANDATFSGVLQGGGLFTKAGTGTLTLTGANTYSGGTALTNGAIRIADGASLGSGGVLTTQADTTLIAGTTTGQTFTLGHDIALNGAFTIDLAGTLFVNFDGAGNVVNANGTTLTLGAISGTGPLTVTGDGFALIGAANSFTGGTTIGNAAVRLTNLGGLGSGDVTLDQGFLFFDATGTFANQLVMGGGSGVLGGSADVALSGGVSGVGQLFKIGANSVTFTGAASTLGTNLFVDQGTALVDNAFSNAALSVLVANGATLGGGGSIAGNVEIASGGILSPGNGIGTLTLGSLLLDAGAVSNYEFNTPNVEGGAGNDLTRVTPGNAVLQGTFNVSTGGASLADGVYTFVTVTGGTLSTSSLSLGSLPALNPGSTASLATSEVLGKTRLIVSGPGFAQYWDGSTVANWDNGVVNGGDGTWDAAAFSFTDATGAANAPWQGHVGYFQGTAGTVAITGAQALEELHFVTSGYVLTDGGGGSLTLNGADIIATDGAINATINAPIRGIGSLTKQGIGTLFLGGDSDYSGGTFLNNSNLAVSNSNALGAGALTIADGGVLVAVANGLNIGNAIVVNGTDIINDNGNSFTLSGLISGTGTLRKFNGGTLILANAGNSYSGGTLLDGGVLQIASDGALGASSGSLTFTSSATLVTTADITSTRAIAIGSGIVATVDTQANDDSFGGAVSGAGTLTKTGSGRLTLTGANTYSGGTNLAGGTLRIAAGNGIGTGALTATTGTTLTAGLTTGSAPITLTNAIAINGEGSLTVDLAGTSGTIDATTGVVTTNGTTLTLNGPITGTGGLITTGFGVLALNAANGYTGGTELNGTLALVGSDTAFGSGTVTLNSAGIENNGGTARTLANAIVAAGEGPPANVIGGSGNLTLTGALSGGGALAKAGTDRLTLTNNASGFSGVFDVNSGELRVDGVLTDVEATVNVNSGGTLSGIGAINGTVNVANAGIIAPGDSPGTLTFGSLNLSSGSILNFEFGAANTIGGPLNDRIVVTNNLTLDGILNVAEPVGGSFTLGIYNVITYGGTLTDNGLAIGSALPNGLSGFVQTLVPGQVNLIVAAPGTLVQYWDGTDFAGNGTIDGGNGSWTTLATNWTGGPPSALNSNWQPNSIGVFAGAAGTVNVVNNFTFQGLQFAVDGYVLAAAGGSLITSTTSFFSTSPGVNATINAPITGAGGIDKQGSGTLRLGGASTYSGGTTVTAGTLALTTNTAIGSGALALGSGTTLRADTSGLVLANLVSTAGTGTVDTGAGVFTLANTVAGPGSITKIGTGNLVLNGSNLFTDLGISAGTVTLGTNTAAGIGGISLAGGTTLAAGAPGLVVGNAISTAGAGTVNSGPGVFTLSNTIFGPGSITKTGAGNLVLGGANLFTDLGISAGTVTLGTNTAAGIGGISMGAGTTLAAGTSGLVINNLVSTAGAGTIDSGPGVFTISRRISGPGSITKAGSGNLVLNGSNAFTDLGISAGTVTLGTNTAGGIGGISLANGTTLAAGIDLLTIGNAISTAGAGTIDTAAFDFTLSNTIFGPGSITKVGSGNLILNGNNLFTNLGISAGRVTLGTNTAAGIGGISLANGTSLTAGVSGLVVGNAISTAGAGTIGSGTGTLTLTNTIFGPGSITKIGTGNLILNGNNLFTNLGISAGTVTLGTNTAAGIGGISLANGTTLAAGAPGLVVGNAVSTAGAGTVNSGPSVFTLSNTIFGPGSITKTGAGNLVLNGANLFTDLGISAGTVTLGTNTAAGIGGISLANGTTLAAGAPGLVVGNAISTAGAGTVNSGPGVFTLSNTIFGPGSITKTGAGNLVLNGANLFTDLGISAGTVTLGSNTAAGIGGISLANGTTLAAGAPGLVVGNAISTAGAGTVNSGPGVFTLSNTIFGPGSITKAGAGNLVLNGSNLFTDLGISAGTVTLGTNTAAGIGGISLAGGTTLAAGTSGLVIGNAISTAGAGTINSGSGVFTLSNTIFGPGSLTKTGAGNLVLNGSNLFTNLGISTGTVTLGTNTAAGIGGISLAGGTTLAAGVPGLVVGNAISTAGAGTVDSGSGVFTLSNTILGPGSITKTGSGNLVLNGASSFTNLGISAGTVTLGTNTAAGIGGISLANGTTLAAGVSGLVVGNAISTAGAGTVDSGAGMFTLSNTIFGPGSITKTGAGNLVLNGANLFTDLGVKTGTVTLGTNTAAGIGGISIGNGATLAAGVSGLVVGNAISTAGAGTVNSGPGVLTLSNTILGPGSITKTGAGNLVLNGANLFTDLGISAGTVTLGTNTAAGIGGISIGAGTTLAAGVSGLVVGNAISTAGVGTINSGPGVFTLSNTMLGPGSITKTGSGTLTLSGASSYTGATAVAAGTLNVTGSLASATTTVASGATLSGTGSIAGAVTIANGGTLMPGGSPGTLTLGSLVLNPTSNVNIELGQANVIAGPFNDLTVVAGNLTLDGLLNVAQTPGGSFGLGIYEVFQYGGTLTDNGLAINSLPGGTAGIVQTLVPGQVNLIITAPGTLVQYWDGADGIGNGVISGGSGTWNALATNWTGAPPSALNANWQGGIGVFAAAAGTVNIAGLQSFQGLQFATDGYVLNGSAGNGLVTNGAAFLFAATGTTATINAPVTGPGSITKQGGGNLVLNGANGFRDLGISAGTVTLGTNTAAGIGGISIGNGTTLAAGVSGLVIGNAISTAGAGTVNSGPGVFTLSNTIFGPGSITKTGAGNLVLNGANLFTDLGISAGTVTLGTNTAAGIGGISIGNGTTLAAGVSGLVIGNAISTAGAGTINAGAGTFTLSNTIFGPGSITTSGGNVVLNGSNLFTDLGIKTGTVTLGTNTAAGIGGISIGNGTTLAAGVSGLVVGNAISTAGAGTIDAGAGTFTLSNTIFGPGSITTTGGNVVLNGSNLFTDLGIKTGTVTLGTNTAAGIGGISLANGTTLAAGVSGLVVGNAVATAGAGTVDSGTGVFTLSNTIFGPGSITKTSAGNLVLNGANLFTDLGISAGTVTLGTNTAAGIGGISIGNGTTLAAGVSGLVVGNAISTAGAGTIDAGAGTFTLSNTIFGPGSITTTGGNVVLNGSNLFTDLGIKTGTVTLGTNTAAGIGGISLANGTTLAAGVSGLVVGNAVATAGAGTVDSGTGVFTLSNTIFGPGSITKTGAGNLVLNGANLFTDLGISAGTVTLGTNTAAGIGGISIGNGTTLAAGVSGLVIGNAISTAGAGTVDSGTGVFTLSNTIFGPGSITKTGTGNLVLNGSNLFTDLGVKTGTVTLGTNTAAGIGGISIGNGTTLAAGVSGLVVGNAISTAGAGTIDAGAGTFTLSNTIFGPGSITTTGGNVVLNGSNLFTDLGIKTGTVTLGTNTAAGIGGISLANGTTLAAGVSGLVIANPMSTAGAGTIDAGAGVFTLNGPIFGPGSITTTGGNVVLNGANSFTNLGVKTGTVTLGTNTAAGNGGISLNGGTTLAAGVSGLLISNAVATAGAGTIDAGAGTFTIAGPIAGPGSITTTGGNVVLNGANSFTNLGVKTGTVTLGTNTAAGNGGISFGAGTTLAAGADNLTVANPMSLAGATTFNSQAFTLNLTGPIAGTGSVTKTGSGTIVLAGASSYTGPTTIAAGRLTVNGSIGASATTVASGATLAGTGTVGTLTVQAGGTVSPAGSAVGNLSVNGGVTFAAGATYAADITPGANDRIIASGPASLNGTLGLNIGAGSYSFTTVYTVLTSSARTGTFTATGLGAFGILYNPTVSYDATSVFVRLAPASLAGLAGGGLSPNQAAVAAAFDRATAAGFNPQPFVGLYSLGAGIGGGLTQLAGEIHSAESRTVLDDTRVVRETAFDRLNAGLEALSGTSTSTTTTAAGDAATTVWLRGAGSWGTARADGIGQRYETKQLGVLTGVDYASGDWKVGAAFTYIHNDLDYRTLGSATVKSTGGAIYGGYRAANGLAVGVGGSIAGVSIDSNRSISIPGLGQTLKAGRDGTVYQAFGEVAFDLAAAADRRIEPFARIAYAKFDASGFSEAGGIAAISAPKQKFDQTIVSGGLRGSVNVGIATLTGSVAYQHIGGDRSPTALLTIGSLGQAAAINAVAQDKDAAAIEAQASFRIGRNATLGVGYSGVIGDRNTDHGARATLTLGF